ncbi:MAG: YraN family protein [Bradyrhizobiaceae bacterium]|nr:YraN family protein [Bradyrhizobiaceae bacterium]
MQNSESQPTHTNKEISTSRSEQTTRPSTTEVGAMAENIARDYLEGLGYVLVTRNFKYGKVGEIDLIMRDSQELVFVEVRYRRSSQWCTPEASIGPTKKKRIRRTAEAYMLTHGITDQACRFDVVAIDLMGGAPVVRHLIHCM